MKVVLQRVKMASVVVEGEEKASVGAGLLLFIGVGRGDTEAIAEHMAMKILKLRVFEDPKGRMDLSIGDIGGEILSVPQFTLLGSTVKGCRPGFDAAAPPREAEALWKEFNRVVRDKGVPISEGVFGAHMEVSILNDGPVTFVLEKNGQMGRGK
jgi:D-aminoacyl-tRNA deacylase